jgi:hypothetical protein
MNIMNKLALMLILLTVACNKQPAPTENILQVDFYAPIQTSSDNEVEISLQIMSPQKDFNADKNFDGRMELFDPNHELRAEAVMKQSPFMKGGELYHIMTWKGFLEPGVYQLDWSAPNYGGTKITFEVYENDSGNYYIGDETIVMFSPN